jgi:hypothetical protein
MTVTLLQLKTQARQRADAENSNFVKDSELTSYINNSIAELHDILSEAYGSEYFVIPSSEISITSGEDTYALPADFYELKGVDLKITQDWVTIEQFNFNERNRFSEFGAWTGAGSVNVRYRLVGDNIQLTPVPDQGATMRLWYVPSATALSADADTFNDRNGYAEFVIVDTAIKMMQKEESDVTVLMAQKQALVDRIRGKAMQRDASKSASISDVYAESDNYFARRNGV